jgi:virginiamycin B lyase
VHDLKNREETMRVIHRAILVTALAVLMPPGLTAQEAADPELTEWEVPYEDSRPRDPYVGPDGHVYFVGQVGHYVAALDPETGEFRRYDLDDGTGPHNLIVGEDGIVWYAGNRASHIGRLDPASGEITKFVMPDERARDPHTLLWDDGGDIWFTVQGGNFVGHFDTEAGETRLVEMPQAPGRGGAMTSSRPYGIEMDSQGRPWICLFNTNAIATVDPSTFESRVYELPEGARPRRIVVDSQDRVWYVDYAQGRLGRVMPGTGEVTEWPMPGGPDSQPYGMAIDSSDRIWFVESGLSPNRFVGFDPANEDFFSITDVESGGGTVRHMYYDESTNSIWFGADTNTVGRAVLPPPKGGIS